MAKEKKPVEKKTPPKQYSEKLKLNVGFHEAMKILADHANTKGTKKITYKGRRKSSK